MKYFKTKEIIYINEKYGCIKTKENLFFYFNIQEYTDNIAFQGFDNCKWFIARENVAKNNKYNNKFFVYGIDKSNFSNINYSQNNYSNTYKEEEKRYGGHPIYGVENIYYNDTPNYSIASGSSYQDIEYNYFNDGEDEMANYFRENGTMEENYKYALGEDEVLD